MVRKRDDQIRTKPLVAVRRYGRVAPPQTRELLLSLNDEKATRFPSGARSKSFIRRPATTGSKKLLAVGGENGTRATSAVPETRQACRPFEGDLPVASCIVKPYAHLPDSNRRHPRLAIRRHRDTFFFGRTKRNLLRGSFRKALAPKMETVSDINAEVHSATIRRPARIRATAWARTCDFAARASVEGNDPAGHPSGFVHFGNEYPHSIGDNPERWAILSSLAGTWTSRSPARLSAAVTTAFYFREQHLPPVNPRKGGGVW